MMKGKHRCCTEEGSEGEQIEVELQEPSTLQQQDAEGVQLRMVTSSWFYPCLINQPQTTNTYWRRVT
jgi:hypothetical protein